MTGPEAVEEPTMGNVAIYCRVSTDDQTTDNQLPEVESMAMSRGTVTARFIETGSAAKTRPVFESMLAGARRGEFQVLVIWSIDRLGRSLAGNVAVIEELDKLGVTVVSIREPWLDMRGPTRGLLVAILSWAAEQERLRLIERTHAGLARARAEGKTLGRRAIVIDLTAARTRLAEGATQEQVAAELGVSVKTLRKNVRAA
jgi:putative DNA-invertase from lambdoid prophage Rac